MEGHRTRKGGGAALCPPRVLYLGGQGRSGSTLAERLLGQAPGVCSAGEVAHLWLRGIVRSERCGCGEPFRRCPFWCEVGEAGFGGWDKVDVGYLKALRSRVDRTRFIPLLAAPRMTRPGFQRALDEYLTYYCRLYSAIAEVSGCEVIVDSSKHASLAFCLSRSPRLDLRVVHLVRDSRGVAYSWTKHVRRPDVPHEHYMRTYAPGAVAGQWIIQNSALDLLSRTRTPVLRVRYEDLVAAPEAVLSSLAEFAGVAMDGSGLRFLGNGADGKWADLDVGHTVSGNPMRFAAGKIKIRCDDAWRTALGPADRLLVSSVTLPWLARYGYLRAAGRGLPLTPVCRGEGGEQQKARTTCQVAAREVSVTGGLV
jgi:hypothetical protein